MFYESRVVSLKLDENVLRELDEEYENIADGVDESAIDRSKHDLATMDSILGAPETIDSLCRDIVKHYEDNRADELTGKALVVAYSRNIAMAHVREVPRTATAVDGQDACGHDLLQSGSGGMAQDHRQQGA